MPSAASAAGRFRGSLALLGTRRFGTFWFATLLSNLGYWAQEVAQPWVLLGLGASSFIIGLDAFMGDAPAWLLTLVGGVLADRADRRRVITVFQSIQMLCPIGLIVLLVTGALRPWMVIVSSLVVGITDALSMPSYQSIVPSIVEPHQIGAGLALSSTQFNLSRILGPATAGALIATVGMIGCFAVNAASYLPFILVALWILPRRTAPTAATTAESASRGRHPFATLIVIWRQPYLRGALLTVAATGLLCSPLITFCPVLVRDALHGGAAQFSIVVALFGVGGLVGAAAMLAMDTTSDQRWLSSRLAMAYGFVVILVAFDPWFWALPVLALLAGAAMTISNTAANTLLQSTASSLQRGQTVSMYMLAMRGGMALGSLVTGISVHLLGIRTALAISGAVAVVVHAVVGRMWLRCERPRHTA